MKKTLKILIKAFACVVLVAFLPLLSATESNTSSERIIYEYTTITQKKGQSLTDALKAAKLSAYQAELVQAIPVMRAAKSSRDFRLAYAVKDGNKLLKEVRVTRDNRMANFVLTGAAGNHKFVSQTSKIPQKVVRIPIKLETAANSKSASKKAVKTVKPADKKPTKIAAKKTTKPVSLPLMKLTGISFMQQKGQTLANAWSSAGLSDYQKNIIMGAKFTKLALSKRQITAYFETAGKRKLLKGLRVIRGKKQVDFIIENKGKTHRLRNLKTVSAEKRQQALTSFSKAKVKKVTIKLASTAKTTAKVVSAKKPKAQSKGKSKTKAKAKPKLVSGGFSKSEVRTKGKYQLVRVYQKTGQSIASAISSVSLTSAQKKLINQIPVMKRAKSTRQFNLLFEKKGSKKYLRAANVTRGKNQADFVLAKHKGKLVWANKKGELDSATSGGFLRYPLSFSRVSSHYNLRRRHPITRRIRPHRGTDFKAPHGRSVWAPADGVVTFSGRQRGYGVTLVIDHGNGYKTKYAHLSRIMRSARKGKRVKKKQIVARVGNTGLSSGAHLHYEVIVNGRHRNPLTVSLPGGSTKKTSSVAKKNAAKYLPRLHKMMR